MQPGIYRIPAEEYHEDPCPSPSLSRSIIKDLLFRSPAHAKNNHPRLNPDFKEEEKVIFDIGTVAHALFLQGIDRACVVSAEDWRTKAAKEAREAARSMGLIPLLAAQYETISKMVEAAHEALRQNADLNVAIADGESELTYIWKEKDIWIRVRPDWLKTSKEIMLDYKTTGQSANPSDFSRLVITTGLDIQGALYRRGVRAIEGIDPKFCLMVQEVNPPYLCSFIGLPPQLEAMGEEKVERGIEIWRKCITTGEWPGYPKRVCYVDMPPWALAQWQERQFDIGLSMQEEF
jgi:hypothetical protein